MCTAVVGHSVLNCVCVAPQRLCVQGGAACLAKLNRLFAEEDAARSAMATGHPTGRMRLQLAKRRQRNLVHDWHNRVSGGLGFLVTESLVAVVPRCTMVITEAGTTLPAVCSGSTAWCRPTTSSCCPRCPSSSG